ncbi:MAG: hypothetical protein ACOCX3_03050 [Chloroflexota bacterium]
MICLTQKRVSNVVDYEPSVIQDKRAPSHEARLYQRIQQVVDNLSENGDRMI